MCFLSVARKGSTVLQEGKPQGKSSISEEVKKGSSLQIFPRIPFVFTPFKVGIMVVLNLFLTLDQVESMHQWSLCSGSLQSDKPSKSS